MRFHYGAVPESPDFIPVPPWRPLKEPSPLLVQFIALPIGIVAAGIVAVLWLTLTPLSEVTIQLSLSTFFLTFAAIVIVHELAHAAVHPGGGLSPRTILGVWPARLVFYAHYDGEMSRNRFIAVFLMPLIVISLLPLAVSAVTQIPMPWLAFVSTFNALLACVDILGAGMLLTQLPATAIARNQGWQTYWRDEPGPTLHGIQ
jgi:hypothetical protein